SAETLAGDLRVGTAIGLFLGIVLGVFIFLLVIVGGFLLVLRLGRSGGDHRVIGAGEPIVIRVDVAIEDIGQAPAFLGDALVFGENAVDRAGEHGDGRHDLADAFLDALGDLDLAFAGQQFDGTHLTHVHAYRVGGAPDVALYRSQRGGGFFGSGLVGVAVCQQQGICIRCSLEDGDSHVIDHADDVFNLLRI